MRCFKYLHQGIISQIKRKSLPEIAKVVGISSPQSLHHFLANSPWSATKLTEKRLTLTLEALRNQKITVIIDETGDRKNQSQALSDSNILSKESVADFSLHQQWSKKEGWKSAPPASQRFPQRTGRSKHHFK